MGQRPKGTTVGKRNTGKVKATAGTHSLLGSAHSEPKKKASSRPKASASETSPQPNAKAASSLALAPGLDNFVSHNSALQQTVSRLDQYVSFTIAPKTVSEQSISGAARPPVKGQHRFIPAGTGCGSARHRGTETTGFQKYPAGNDLASARAVPRGCWARCSKRD